MTVYLYLTGENHTFAVAISRMRRSHGSPGVTDARRGVKTDNFNQQNVCYCVNYIFMFGFFQEFIKSYGF
jgi:hypothetical protein